MWKSIPTAPGYLVSDDGRVRGLRGWILKPQAQRRSGHLSVLICGGPTKVRRTVHSLVMEAFVGPRPDGLEVCHCDDDPTNNVLSNLRYDTREANRADMVRNGRHHMARRDTCGSGHEYTKENTRETPRGRVCRACDRDRHARHRSKL